MGRRKIQQDGQVYFLQARFYGIAKGDVDYDANLCRINFGGCCNTQPAILGLFAKCARP
jgi:hypothetical protein